MGTRVFLLVMLVMGMLAQSRVIMLASFILLILLELQLESLFIFLSSQGIEIGLVFLLLAILSSVLLSSAGWSHLKASLLTPRGIIAAIAGLLATRFNGLGLELLNSCPQLIVGIVAGSFLGILFFGGIPVGPLMAAGIAALLLKIFSLLI